MLNHKYVTLGSIRWLGWLDFSLFTALSYMHDWGGLGFLFPIFSALGMYILIGSYCKYAVDDTALYACLAPLNWHCKMNWNEVESVELGSLGTLVFYGAGKRFVLPSVTYWSGNEKPAMHKRLVEQFELRKIVPILSNTAEYRFNKNVRVNNAAD